MLLNVIHTLLLLLPLIPFTTAARPKNAILLSQVKALTLRSSAKTAHRRVSAVPQLTCTGPGCSYFTVDTMRCKNMGSSYGTEDIEWSCEADTPTDFKLGSTEVTCEGYESSNDEYVLKGSCGVTYRLLLTEKGEEKYGKNFGKGKLGYGEESNVPGTIFSILFIIVLIIIVVGLIRACNAAPNNRPRPGGNWGGGGGRGEPPPPYDDDWTPRPKGSSWANYGTNNGGNRPGWLSAAAGAAAAGAAGYAGGRYAGRNQQTQPAPSTPSSSFRTSSPPSSSSSTHTTTGFGSTSRR